MRCLGLMRFGGLVFWAYSGFRVQGLGFRVKGLGFRVQGLGFRAYAAHRFWGLGSQLFSARPGAGGEGGL